MPNDDEEKTKPLYDLGELNSNNQIFEVEKKVETSSEALLEEQSMSIKKKKEPFFSKVKKWWKLLSKKKKIFFLLGILLIIVILTIGIFFLVKNQKKDEILEKQPDVIVQEENYRYENGKLLFLDAEKREIGSYNCQNANQELCFVAYYSNEDDFDLPKKVYKDATGIPTRSAIISSRYVFVSDNSKMMGVPI